MPTAIYEKPAVVSNAPVPQDDPVDPPNAAFFLIATAAVAVGIWIYATTRVTRRARDEARLRAPAQPHRNGDGPPPVVTLPGIEREEVGAGGWR